jgi:hypothetical protein
MDRDLNGQTLFAIKRDHVQGFDKLHASAFYDAVKFDGLPQGIADFDKARSTGVSMIIKSQDGVSEDVIITNELMAQGNGASPIKYNLSMGMVTHWLEHGGMQGSRIPILHSYTSVKEHSAPHVLSLEDHPVQLLSVEAMDDSIWFASDWADLKVTVQRTEQFQDAYNIQTHWDSPNKTVCFTLGRKPANPPTELTFDTPLGSKVVPYTVTPSLLRTTLHDAHATLKQLLTIVEDFPIPQNKSMPLPQLRNAMWF